MEANVGKLDQLLRFVCGTFAMLVGFLFIQGVFGIIIGILGVIAVVTGAIRYCGAYTLLGISTIESDQKEASK